MCVCVLGGLCRFVSAAAAEREREAPLNISGIGCAHSSHEFRKTDRLGREKPDGTRCECSVVDVCILSSTACIYIYRRDVFFSFVERGGLAGVRFRDGWEMYVDNIGVGFVYTLLLYLLSFCLECLLYLIKKNVVTFLLFLKLNYSSINATKVNSKITLKY